MTVNPLLPHPSYAQASNTPCHQMPHHCNTVTMKSEGKMIGLAKKVHLVFSVRWL